MQVFNQIFIKMWPLWICFLFLCQASNHVECKAIGPNEDTLISNTTENDKFVESGNITSDAFSSPGESLRNIQSKINEMLLSKGSISHTPSINGSSDTDFVQSNTTDLPYFEKEIAKDTAAEKISRTNSKVLVSSYDHSATNSSDMNTPSNTSIAMHEATTEGDSGVNKTLVGEFEDAVPADHNDEADAITLNKEREGVNKTVHEENIPADAPVTEATEDAVSTGQEDKRGEMTPDDVTEDVDKTANEGNVSVDTAEIKDKVPSGHDDQRSEVTSDKVTQDVNKTASEISDVTIDASSVTVSPMNETSTEETAEMYKMSSEPRLHQKATLAKQDGLLDETSSSTETISSTRNKIENQTEFLTKELTAATDEADGSDLHLLQNSSNIQSHLDVVPEEDTSSVKKAQPDSNEGSQPESPAEPCVDQNGRGEVLELNDTHDPAFASSLDHLTSSGSSSGENTLSSGWSSGENLFSGSSSGDSLFYSSGSSGGNFETSSSGEGSLFSGYSGETSSGDTVYSLLNVEGPDTSYSRSSGAFDHEEPASGESGSGSGAFEDFTDTSSREEGSFEYTSSNADLHSSGESDSKHATSASKETSDMDETPQGAPVYSLIPKNTQSAVDKAQNDQGKRLAEARRLIRRHTVAVMTEEEEMELIMWVKKLLERRSLTGQI